MSCLRAPLWPRVAVPADTSSGLFSPDWVSGALCPNSSYSANLLCDFRQVTDALWAFTCSSEPRHYLQVCCVDHLLLSRKVFPFLPQPTG